MINEDVYFIKVKTETGHSTMTFYNESAWLRAWYKLKEEWPYNHDDFYRSSLKHIKKDSL